VLLSPTSHAGVPGLYEKVDMSSSMTDDVVSIFAIYLDSRNLFSICLCLKIY
jgi:hypothetical protein